MKDELAKIAESLSPCVRPVQVLDRIKIQRRLWREYNEKPKTQNQLCCALVAPSVENVIFRIADNSDATEKETGLCFQYTSVQDGFPRETDDGKIIAECNAWMCVKGLTVNGLDSDAQFELLGLIAVELYNNGSDLRPVYLPYHFACVSYDLHDKGLKVSEQELELQIPLIRRQKYFLQTAFEAYATAQMILSDFPEAMKNAHKEFARPNEHHQSKHKKQKKRMKQIKSYRVIELAAATSDKKAIAKVEDDANKNLYNCPLWTVRGHFRHLGKGKVIWIKGYRKGVLRNKVGAELSPKEYTT